MIDTILLSVLVLGMLFLEWRASRIQKLMREATTLLRHVAEEAVRGKQDRLIREAAGPKRNGGKD